MTHKMMPMAFTTSSLYSIDISGAILADDIEEFKTLLNSTDEQYKSLSEDKRYAIAYSACLNLKNRKFLEYLIFDLNLRENLIAPQYITEEVKALFVQRKAEQLSKELGVNDIKKNNIKI